MSDILGKVFTLIIAVVILFIAPLLSMFETQDDTTRVFVLTETTKFVDSARNLGYITPNMYNELIRKISKTNNIYSVDMEHYHVRYDPIYDDPTVVSTFKDDYNINYQGIYTDDIKDILFPSTPSGNEKYTMSKGDYFALKVANKNKTIATKIQEMIFNADLGTEKIIVRYGGMIKNN